MKENKQAPLRLNGLREELSIEKIDDPDAYEPQWRLYDPACHDYYHMGLLEFMVLTYWHLKDIPKIVETINSKTKLNITEKDVQDFFYFLRDHGLLKSETQKDIEGLLEKKRKQKMNKIRAWCKSYLFFKFRIYNPDKFLNKTFPYIKGLFSKKVLYAMLVMLALSVVFIIHSWHDFVTTSLDFFNFKGFLYFIMAVIFSKIFHELGHAYVSKYYGCSVTNIGIAFIVLWPVLYTDTTDAWKLDSRRQRAMIDAGGMLAELGLAAVSGLLWVFLTPGFAKSIAFFLCTSSWLITIGVNINPLLRFDGYYLFSDLFNVVNLQQKSFALGKWMMRKKIIEFYR